MLRTPLLQEQGKTSGKVFRNSRFQGEYPSHSHVHSSPARVAQRGLRVSTAGSCPSSATARMSDCGQVSPNLSVLSVTSSLCERERTTMPSHRLLRLNVNCSGQCQSSQCSKNAAAVIIATR